MKLLPFLLFVFSSLTCTAQSKPKTENVFLITLDGFRWQELYHGADSMLVANKEYVQDTIGLKTQFWRRSPEQRREVLMPFFWKVVAANGQLYGNRKFGNKVNCSNHMWFSYPGYSEILCGYPDDERIHSNDKIENPNVTVLEYLNGRPAFRGKVAAFGSWDVFPYIINEKRSGIPVNAGYETATGPLSEREGLLNELIFQIPAEWNSVRYDAFTFHYALEYAKRNLPRVMYISFGETDDFAHEGRYDAYLKSARQTDGFIEQLWEWTQTQPQYRDKTTLLITTDHGRGTVPPETWRSHGTKVDGSDQIWVAVMGPDTPASGEIQSPGQFYQNQIARTVALFLQQDYTGREIEVGKPISSMIKEVR